MWFFADITNYSKKYTDYEKMLKIRHFFDRIYIGGILMENVIEIKGLSKCYGTVKAVDNLSLRVKKGELFAFLGVNGAGKSTTINIMCGTLVSDSGLILIDGLDAVLHSEKVKNKLGIVFQSSALDPALTVYENLESRAALYGIVGEAFKVRLGELSRLLELDGLLKRTLDKLSGGQRRRIDIARALIHKPEILVLDEPTTGLDPQTRKVIWNVVSDLRKNENMTVFLTTHYMEEAAEADYVVIIDKGRIAAEGTPLELKNSYTGDFITIYGQNEDEIATLGYPYEKISGAIRISVPNTGCATDLIIKNPEMFSDYEITKGKMDDVFLNVTGIKPEGGEEK